MTTRRGRCNNIGLCENATRQRTIEVDEQAPFVCPKCGTELVSVDDRKSTRSAASVALPVVVIALALAGVGYAAWDLYGRPAATHVGNVAPRETKIEPDTAPAATGQPTPVASPAPAVVAAPDAPAPGAAPATVAPPAPAPAATTTASPTAAAPVAEAPTGASAPAAAPPADVAQPAPSTPEAPAVATPPEATPAPAAAPDAAPADAAQRVQAFLGGAKRVPITFTFRSGEVALTRRSAHDVERLVGYLRQHHATGEHVYLAGFTDNQGDPAANDAVSQKRVAAVAAALGEAGIPPAHVASFGAALPVADNATLAGRDRNRRVEVYLAP